MPINRERLDRVKSRWGAYSSWAVWKTIADHDKPKADVGDRSVLDPDVNAQLLTTLNPEVVMLGLNAATRAIDPEPWSNFHDGRPMANDFKIRFAFERTPFWGAYMTDVFVGLHETDSSKVAQYTKANPAVVATQLERLEAELQDVGANDPLLIVFGAHAYQLVRRNLGGRFRAVRVMHYANRIEKTSYRASVLTAIARFDART